MEWLNVSNLINVILLILGWGIKNELSHIGANIEGVKNMVTDAKTIGLKAHERIDHLIERRGNRG